MVVFVVLQLGFTVYVIILLVACVITVEFLTIELLVHMCPFPKGEMFHGKRWRSDSLYQAPMMQTAHFQVYAGDFVLVQTHQECSLGQNFTSLHEGTHYCIYTRHYTKYM